MDNIQKTEDGNWKVLGMDGEELEKSPYDTKKKAKQALNAHKMNYSVDEYEDQDEDEDSSEMNDKDSDSSGGIISLLSNKYVAGALLVGGGLYYISTRDSSSSKSSDSVPDEIPEDVKEEENIQEEEQDENLDDGRRSASDLFT